MERPAVIGPPAAPAQLKRGFDTLAQLLGLTLGPLRGSVLSGSALRSAPEVLSDAGTIARRMIALPDRAEDAGAMLLRNLVWRVHQQTGDGGATTAVLAQAILHEATRVVAAGANAMEVRRGIQRGAEAAQAALAEMAEPLHGEAAYAAVAQAATGNAGLGFILGEVFELLGPHGYVTVEKFVAPTLDRVYLNGGKWSARLISPYLMTARPVKRSILQDVRVAIFHGQVTEAEEVAPLLGLAAGLEPAHLLLAAQNISGDALNATVSLHQQGKAKIAAVALRRAGEHAQADFADLGRLSGARVLIPEAGQRLSAITIEDLGKARRIEAGLEELLVMAGGGTRDEIRAQIELLSGRLDGLDAESGERHEIEMRLARLAGSTAVVKVGAIHQAERDALQQRAEQGIRALRAALEEGVAPGGGAAYLGCIEAVRRLRARGDEKLGVKALERGLEAPLRRILENAKVEAPGLIRDALSRRGPGHVYDVVRGQIAPAREIGLLDPVKVLRVALGAAAGGAAMCLSTDLLVLRRNPPTSAEP